MGFLDHSTNNIILDAVLTDAGRRQLAANRGDFRIAYFSLADDEVDYGLITKFGRAIGKEKISKNTPIFEAQTNAQIALKNRLLSLPDPTVTRLPTITALVSGTESVALSRLTASKQEAEVSLEQSIVGGATIPDGAADSSFTIIVPDRFVNLPNRNFFAIDEISRMASYTLVAGGSRNSSGGAQTNFRVRIASGLDDEMFDGFGDQGNKSQISSVITIIGNQTGFRKDVQLTITKT
tara:strand:+ start:297 stop:1007 length:711 start_codon:yes stop_codon:yes gene_type:complete